MGGFARRFKRLETQKLLDLDRGMVKSLFTRHKSN